MITIAEGRIFSKAAEITAADKASLPRPGGSPGGAEALVRSGVGEDGGEGSGESDIFEGLRKQGVGRKRRGGDVDVDVDEDVEWMGKEVGFWRRDCEEWGGKGRGEMRREMTEKERERKGGEGSEGGIGMGMGIERGVSGGGG